MLKAKFHYDIQVADQVCDMDSVMECGLLLFKMHTH